MCELTTKMSYYGDIRGEEHKIPAVSENGKRNLKAALIIGYGDSGVNFHLDVNMLRIWQAIERCHPDPDCTISFIFVPSHNITIISDDMNWDTEKRTLYNPSDGDLKREVFKMPSKDLPEITMLYICVDAGFEHHIEQR